MSTPKIPPIIHRVSETVHDGSSRRRPAPNPPSGATTMGDTRDGNWGCHPFIFSEKPGDLFFAHHCITVSIAFYCFHSGVTLPLEAHPTLFYLSDLVSPLFFVNLPINFFPSGVTPLEGVTRDGPPPPHSPSDATGCCTTHESLPNMHLTTRPRSVYWSAAELLPKTSFLHVGDRSPNIPRRMVSKEYRIAEYLQYTE